MRGKRHEGNGYIQVPSIAQGIAAKAKTPFSEVAKTFPARSAGSADLMTPGVEHGTS